MNSSTLPLNAAKRVANFNAGPGPLPLAVLERIREELLEYRGTGMSVMEMSHRSAEYEEIQSRAEQALRRHLSVPQDYAVIFLQGGASMQFTMVPMNLCPPGKSVDVLHTGMWTKKAITELKKSATCRMAASSEAEKFTRVPRMDEIAFDSFAAYVHMASNNTIEGTQWQSFPAAGDVPLVADMSSDILSRSIEVRRFGLIFAGAQKNLGPSGATVVIVRRDLAERASKDLPTLLQYRTHIQERSLYHTPPTFAIYILGLMMEWVE
ncbi:MAG: 3-phosphoserine/phosphohydroxythreonine transaminase, partial [Candidatus Acidiferrales bacterium]